MRRKTVSGTTAAPAAALLLFADSLGFQGRGAFLAERPFFEQLAHAFAGAIAIEPLLTLLLHFHFQARRQVLEVDATGRLVDPLAARAGGMDEPLLQVRLA